MRLIPLESLYIPANRQRQLFAEKPLSDLCTSILSKGLMHPPVVKPVNTVNGNGQAFELVAGERRWKAIKNLYSNGFSFHCDGELVPAGQIPVISLSDLGAFGFREAELEENTIREALTWQEQSAAIAELHALRTEQAAAAGTKQTIAATATELKNDGTEAKGYQQTVVSDALILANHLDDPEVQKAKSAKDALKIVRRKAEVAHRAMLASQFDKQTSVHHLVHSDSLEYLLGYESDTFDCILTDPPYGVGANTFSTQASTGHNYQDDQQYADRCYETLAKEGFRICKSVATLYAFCDIRQWSNIALTFEIYGWNVWSTPLIWVKSTGMLPVPNLGPRRTYEAILMATKGEPQFRKVGAGDAIIIPSSDELDHGAQKPVALFAELLTRSTLPGNKVLDPFVGSGTIFPAANQCKVIAYGVEKVKENYDLALSRMFANEVDLGV